MSIPISQFLPPTLPHSCLFICSLHLCLYFCFANLSICTIFLDSSYMRWYVIFFSHLLILILKDSVLEISGTWPYFPGITWGRHKPAAQSQEGNYESRSLCSTNPSCTPGVYFLLLISEDPSCSAGLWAWGGLRPLGTQDGGHSTHQEGAQWRGSGCHDLPPMLADATWKTCKSLEFDFTEEAAVPSFLSLY